MPIADITANLRFLLLQVRNSDDPMRQHEVDSFARVLQCPPKNIGVFDLLGSALTRESLRGIDMLLLGGSGHYSAATPPDPPLAKGGIPEWLVRALDSLRLVHDNNRPTFASCWGFQAMACAMGGTVIKDLERAEVGTHRIFLTSDGRADPVFGPLGESFLGQMGHEDHVVELPANATLLAYSDKVAHQAYRFDDAPIYCTQFHPELTRDDLLIRVENYPEYIERIAGLPPERFVEMVEDTSPSEGILTRFVERHFA